MRLFLTVLFLLGTVVGFTQTKAELDSLTKVLEVVYERDQVPRLQLDSIEQQYGYHSMRVKEQWKLIESNDSANILAVTQILNNLGWLSETQTSKTANSALFLAVQHAELSLQIKYIGIVKQAVEKGNAKPSDYAYLVDRVNMRQGKLQIYGSQFSISTNGKAYLYPVKDEPGVNARRKKIGLPPLQETARKFGFVYNLPGKDRLKNKLIVTGFVIEKDQTPINGVHIKFGSKVAAKTNADGFYQANIEENRLKEPLTFTKDGYIVSDPPLKNEGKEVYELSIMLTKK